jgi:glycerol transport system substrate-binding protein
VAGGGAALGLSLGQWILLQLEITMFDNNNKRRHLTLAACWCWPACMARPGPTYEDAAKKWIGSEFKPSTLTPDQQLEEMKWFIKAAEPFRGMKINVVSETITTHEYESKVLAKAFTEITGIKLTHDLLQEGDVVEKLQTRCSRTRTSMTAGSTTPT